MSKDFYVTVVDNTTRRYIIEAENEEDAREVAESGDLDPRTGKLIDSEWRIESVEGVSPSYPILDEIAKAWAEDEGLDLTVQDSQGIWGAMQEIASRWEDVGNIDNAFYSDPSFVEGITQRLLHRIEERFHG